MGMKRKTTRRKKKNLKACPSPWVRVVCVAVVAAAAVVVVPAAADYSFAAVAVFLSGVVLVTFAAVFPAQIHHPNHYLHKSYNST
jgi:hypothetical protein